MMLALKDAGSFRTSIFFLYAWEEKDREDGRAMGFLEQVRIPLEVRLGPAQPHPISSRKRLPLSRK